jgi:hypothetical protein
MVWSGEALAAAVVRGRGGAAAAPLTALQAEAWRLLAAEWADDAAAQAVWRAAEAARLAGQPGAAALARAFAAGDLALEDWRAQFDAGARGAWTAFGLRGPAGAMFLNRLVKHAAAAGRTPELDVALRAAVAAPGSAREAGARLGAFARYVCDRGPAAQPGLAVGFAAACWALQTPRVWPAHAPATRRVLDVEEGVFRPAGEPTADYLALCAAVAQVGEATGLHPWALEALCRWHARRLDDGAGVGRDGDAAAVRRPPTRRGGRVREAAPAGCFTLAERARRAAHAAAPAAARGGPAGPAARPRRPRTPRCSGCWRASGTSSGAACGSRPTTTAGAGAGSGSATSASSACPRWRSTPTRSASSSWWTWCGCAARRRSRRRSRWSGARACIRGSCAWPTSRRSRPTWPCRSTSSRPRRGLDKVRRELRRPAMRALALDRRCGFFSAEALQDAAPDLARWATGPAAIDRLAERVDGP